MKNLGWHSAKLRQEVQNDGTGAVGLVTRLGIGAWTILVVLFLLLAATVVTIYVGWRLASGTDVPASGYAAMALGVIVSLGVGFGLMALIFYSSRKGYDEPPVLILPGGTGIESAAVCEAENESHVV